jgi:hypothetical protein
MAKYTSYLHAGVAIPYSLHTLYYKPRSQDLPIKESTDTSWVEFVRGTFPLQLLMAST